MTILTVTLNPAIDMTTSVGKLVSGPKMRCGTPRFDPGGGGVNVSRAIAKLGGRSTPFVSVGGATGEMFKSLLDQEDVKALWHFISGMTRQSIAVDELETGEQYRFVLPGPQWSTDDCTAALSLLEKGAREIRASYIVASGSLPPGPPDDFYHRMSSIAEELGLKFVLDTSGRALDAAAKGGTHRPYLWVMDNGEASHLAGRELDSMADLQGFARELRSCDLVSIVVLTHRHGGAVALSEDEAWRFQAPKVEVGSKVGAGDSFVGGLVYRLAAGWSLADACAYAVAAATSAVTTPATELCNGEQTEKYYDLVKREAL